MLSLFHTHLQTLAFTFTPPHTFTLLLKTQTPSLPNIHTHTCVLMSNGFTLIHNQAPVSKHLHPQTQTQTPYPHTHTHTYIHIQTHTHILFYYRHTRSHLNSLTHSQTLILCYDNTKWDSFFTPVLNWTHLSLALSLYLTHSHTHTLSLSPFILTISLFSIVTLSPAISLIHIIYTLSPSI